jgi:hypothetical protein
MSHQLSDTVLYPALAKETLPPTNKRTLASVVISVVVLFLVLNILVYWAIAQYDRRNLMRKFTLIDLLDEPVDVLLFGDSSVSTGINPQGIESETGLRALNLSLNTGWTYYNDVWMLEYYIEKFGAPSYIVWGHAYDNNHFVFDPVTQLSGVTHFHGLEHNSQYVTPNMTPIDELIITVRRLFPFYFRDQTVATLVDRILSREPLFRTDEDLIATVGYDAKTVVNMPRVEADARSQVLRDDYDFSTDNLRVIDVFFDMIDQHDIPTYIVVTPVHEWIGDREDFLDATQTLRQFWHDASQQYDHVQFNPEVPVFASHDMFDADHLNVYGAEVYTQYLVDWIWGEYQPTTLDDIYAKRNQ